MKTNFHITSTLCVYVMICCEVEKHHIFQSCPVLLSSCIFPSLLCVNLALCPSSNFPQPQGNFISDNCTLRQDKYDVILALSITKWIHLNWGDDGIKTFFQKVHSSLRDGGCFILEPQPFDSYKRKKRLTVRY